MNIIEKTYKWASKLSKRKTTKRIILHHAEAVKCTADDIHKWHLNNGWSGIGYHFLVRKDGTIYRGRPEDTLGSHAKGANSDSIGICAEGSYMKETMPEAQKQAIKELVAHLKSKYGITKVQRHKDVTSTDCPGTNFPFDEIVNGGSAPVPAPQPQNTGYKVKVNTPSGVNCRNAPNGAKVKAYPNGKFLTITQEKDGWGYTGEGWVSLQYCTRVQEAAPQNTSSNKLGTYEVIASDLIVRDAPNGKQVGHGRLSPDGKKHDKDKDGALDCGTRVTIMEIRDGWGRCPSGWISMKYLCKV